MKCFRSWRIISHQLVAHLGDKEVQDAEDKRHYLTLEQSYSHLVPSLTQVSLTVLSVPMKPLTKALSVLRMLSVTWVS